MQTWARIVWSNDKWYPPKWVTFAINFKIVNSSLEAKHKLEESKEFWAEFQQTSHRKEGTNEAALAQNINSFLTSTRRKKIEKVQRCLSISNWTAQNNVFSKIVGLIHVPVFLNDLADFCLVSDNLGGWWNYGENDASEMKETGRSEIILCKYDDKYESQSQSNR